MIRVLRAWLIIVSVLFSLCAGAEQTVEQGPWVLHYMTMNTTELTPKVANSYGVKRSKHRGLLMLNLQRKDAPLKSVEHRAEGHIRNLIGQTKTDTLRRVEAGGAIYTLVEYSYSHLETLRFDFQITPLGDASPLQLKFHQQHFTPGR